MHLFYTPTLLPAHQNFVLTEEESKHAVRVLRLQQGNMVYLVDGRGGWYTAEILDPHPKRTTLTITHVVQEYEKPSYHLHVAIAPTKNIDRIEWFLEKATEVGIQEITPIICEHSERKEVKLDRLNKVVISAMKQSLKAYLPQINPAISLSQFLQQQNEKNNLVKCIAHCADGEKKYLQDVAPPNANYVLLIGPEGDFSENEIKLAQGAGFHAISLGNSRLRTETAGLTSCIEVALLNR